MKKFTVALLSAVIAASTLFAGCGGTPSGGGGGTIDASKTQIYVDNYTGGLGQKWLTELIKRFEAEYADYEGVDGKVGVEVKINPHKNKGNHILNTIENSTQDIYFSEDMAYYDLTSRNLAMDITDVVTSDNSDGKTIESKLDAAQVSYFKNGDSYYGLPHAEIFYGITYNKDIFDEKLLYLSDNPSVNGGFVTTLTDTRSKGPDGKTGVIGGVDYSQDDGLPATYEEFFKVCDRMITVDVIPFTWSGEYGKAYVSGMLSQLLADYEGKEQTLLNLSLDGVAKNLISSISDSGEITFAGDTTITAANGYEMYKSAGRYYALKFLANVFSKQGYYDSKNIINTADSHTDAQTRYILSNYDPDSTPIAMFIDGTYWENEAEGVNAFSTLESVYGVKRSETNFAYLPAPKATADKVGEKSTLLEAFDYVAFIDAGLAKRNPEKVAICKEFLKFAYTDTSLCEFTMNTGIRKALNYEISDSQKASLSPYYRSVLDITERSDIVYPYSNSKIYVNNQSKLAIGEGFVTNSYAFPYSAIKDGVSAKQYFNDMIAYRGASWWNNEFSRFFN